MAEIRLHIGKYTPDPGRARGWLRYPADEPMMIIRHIRYLTDPGGMYWRTTVLAYKPWQ